MNTPTLPDDAANIAIIGSREFPSLWMVRVVVDRLDPNRHTVVSGGASGVDSIAVDQAKYRGIQFKEFKPDYVKHGRYKAPHVRNDEILKEADYVIAFWDGISGGTYSVIEKAKKLGVPYVVYEPEPRPKRKLQS